MRKNRKHRQIKTMLPRRIKIKNVSAPNVNISPKWLGQSPLVLKVHEPAGVVQVVDDETGDDNVLLPVAWFENNEEFRND